MRNLASAIARRPDLSTLPGYDGLVLEWRAIRIEHPRLMMITRAVNELRVEARMARGSEQYVLPIIGPSQSGKSLALQHYRETVVAREDHPPGAIPVLGVVVSNGSSRRQLQADILRPLAVRSDGTPDPSVLRSGTEASFRAKVAHYARERGTEAIFIDEAQHLMARRKAGAEQVAETIKLMAIEGAASFVVLGVPSTWQIFRANDEQLPLRTMPPILLNPLDFGRPDEAAQFIGYVALLDQKLVDHGLTRELSGFYDGDMPACFWEVSQGVIGRVSRLVRTAWNVAYSLGEPVVDRELLAYAVDEWALPMGLCKTNPFRDGARGVAVVRADADRLPEDFEA